MRAPNPFTVGHPLGHTPLGMTYYVPMERSGLWQAHIWALNGPFSAILYPLGTTGGVARVGAEVSPDMDVPVGKPMDVPGACGMGNRGELGGNQGGVNPKFLTSCLKPRYCPPPPPEGGGGSRRKSGFLPPPHPRGGGVRIGMTSEIFHLPSPW